MERKLFKVTDIIFVLTIFSIYQYSQATGCMKGQVAHGGNCYWFVNTTCNQHIARASCVAQGMDLVAIETEAEQDFLKEHITSFGHHHGAWIGLASELYGGGGGGFASSSSSWQSYQVLPTGTAYQEFSVRTEGSNAQVVLADDTDTGSRYLIAIGAYHDTAATISRCADGKQCEVMKQRALKRGIFRNDGGERLFAVKCYRGKIQIQTIDEAEPRLNLGVMDENPISCNYIGFSSGSGSFIGWGYWHRFAWSDGGHPTYMNWSKNSPRDKFGGARCVTMTTSTGLWKNMPCKRKYPFICESTSEPDQVYSYEYGGAYHSDISGYFWQYKD